METHRGMGLVGVGIGLLLCATPVRAAQMPASAQPTTLEHAVSFVLLSPPTLVAYVLPESKNGMPAPKTDLDSALFAGD